MNKTRDERDARINDMVLLENNITYNQEHLMSLVKNLRTTINDINVRISSE